MPDFRLENEDREPDQRLIHAFEFYAKAAVGINWGTRFHPELIANLGRYRRYDYTSLRDLLRVIRNKRNHFREMPENLQGILGPLPSGFLRCAAGNCMLRSRLKGRFSATVSIISFMRKLGDVSVEFKLLKLNATELYMLILEKIPALQFLSLFECVWGHHGTSDCFAALQVFYATLSRSRPDRFRFCASICLWRS